jgi:oxygen-dependent protoporphyrinogen oxidase
MAGERVDVAIVGGGISGLSAAYALHKRGVSFRLLEASERFGGVIRTERDAGFVLEGGPDALLAQKPEGIALCRELGLGENLVSTLPTDRAVHVLHRGRLHPLPEGMMLAVPTRIAPFAASSLFSWPAKLRMGFDLVIPRRQDEADESIASFLRRRLGQECVDRLGEPLLAGIHSGDPERLSMRASFPRFLDLERRHGSLIRGMWAAAAQVPTGKPAGSAFMSLRGGLVDLVEALVARLPEDRLRRGSRVAEVARRSPGFAVRLADGSAIEALAVILASPPSKTAPLLEPLLPEAARALASITFVSTATVLLGYRRESVAHPLAGYGFVVPKGEGLRTSAFTFVSSKLPDRAPDGHVLLRGFLGGARDPDVLDGKSDAALADIVMGEMTPLLGLRGAPVVSRVFRWPATTPQLEVGHLERIAAAECQIATVPGLYLTGAGVRVTGIPDCVADGTKIAEAAAAFVAQGLDTRAARV